MSKGSVIEWTESTWNPVTGCSKLSPGCANCYAERMAKRLQAMRVPQYADGFAVRTHESVLSTPLAWSKPQMIFVNSMSDLFHEEIPLAFIKRVFSVMKEAHWHTFQVLTKRSERLAELSPVLDWPENVWMGVSVEHDLYTNRVGNLRKCGAAVKFLSCEPLLGPLPSLNLTGIDWVIVGGESGPGSRPIQQEWVLQIKDLCLATDTPFFFKQWGGTRKKQAGRLLEGRTWDGMPAFA